MKCLLPKKCGKCIVRTYQVQWAFSFRFSAERGVWRTGRVRQMELGQVMVSTETSTRAWAEFGEEMWLKGDHGGELGLDFAEPWMLEDCGSQTLLRGLGATVLSWGTAAGLNVCEKHSNTPPVSNTTWKSMWNGNERGRVYVSVRSEVCV